MKRSLVINLMIIFFIFYESSYAQIIFHPNTGSRQNFSFEASMDPAFVVEGGYHYRIDNVIAGKSLLIHSLVKTPLFLLKEFDSFQFGFGGSVKLVERGKYGLVGGLFTSIATNENVNGNFIAWGFKLNFLPGFYSENWFAVFDFAWKPTLLTHITHSNYVKDSFKDRYPTGIWADEMIDGPKDGWYSTPANRLMAGILAGYTISKSYTIYINGGINYTPNDFGIFMFGDIGIIPYYLKLGMVYHK